MLRRWVLASFVLTFLLLIASMEIVAKVSTDKHGFGPTDTKLHYLWTYGPTAGTKILLARDAG
ncbi:hypothetical protein P153DRAFT_370285 [Dothidotthia symphoricarpi CBS 119687]|uniref:Uncharacterized protein n=1 Tax=Dothidotthia symphoricarpi CBS 119687 TaxID=1392245 RepID=A0A6A5ZZG6_9PLEO|nr:uncharacterized protein P153DRAFT_370285 [Dothidotthia symphoricarpi CBS 119687]KAF2124959.1 hypothetical protein P153DRAFT_370285 [Dothidotthia symphoricarpi CBS 119687]